jgi:hypothetical protein
MESVEVLSATRDPRLEQDVPCRSYGAWLEMPGGFGYKHGAPLELSASAQAIHSTENNEAAISPDVR